MVPLPIYVLLLLPDPVIRIVDVPLDVNPLLGLLSRAVIAASVAASPVMSTILH
jgi:hypothetical protein